MSGLDQYVLRSVDDWRFFFHRAKAQMGIRAIDYSTMLVRSSGGHVYVAGPDDKKQRAARRHARIEAALQVMPAAELSVVRTTCEDDPREAWELFGRGGLGNIAHLAPAAARAHRASGTTRAIPDWLDRVAFKLTHGGGTAEQRILRERIVTDIESILRMAHDAYDSVRRSVAGGIRP